jgi:hypothetical protein
MAGTALEQKDFLSVHGYSPHLLLQDMSIQLLHEPTYVYVAM